MGLSRIEIERSAQKTKVTLYVSKPGLVIGRGGSGIDMLRQELGEIIQSKKVQLAVTEVKRPMLSAKIIADEAASQIERRVSEKRILSSLVEKVMEAGALGVKVSISGRISGQDIARTVFKTEGSVPLQKISADIDFARATAVTKYGTTGLKVWINRSKAVQQKEATKEPKAKRNTKK